VVPFYFNIGSILYFVILMALVVGWRVSSSGT
jgi:hypothetical protein